MVTTNLLRFRTAALGGVPHEMVWPQRDTTASRRCQGDSLPPYVAINRRDAVQPAFDALLGVVDEVLPITRSDALLAREIVLGSSQLSARDAIHLAVMKHQGIATLMSFDRGFDGYPGVTRLT